MDKAEVIVLEGALAFGGLRRCWLGATIEAFGLEDAPDAVAVEMRQEMGDDKRQVIEREVGDPAQRADNGALRLGCLPGQLVRPRRMVQAVCRTTLAPLADGLGGDAIALGEEAAALLGAGDLGPRDGRGAGVRRDLQHRSDLPLSDLDQTFKQVAVGGNSMSHRVPTMLRNLTATAATMAVSLKREILECHPLSSSLMPISTWFPAAATATPLLRPLSPRTAATLLLTAVTLKDRAPQATIPLTRRTF